MPYKTVNGLFLIAFFTGFSTISVQIVMLRELMVLFRANELSTGIILANWMLSTGIGALAGGYVKKQTGMIVSVIVFFLLAILPIILFTLLICIYPVIVPVGLSAGLNKVFVISFITLFPYCCLSGYLLILLSSMASLDSGTNNISRIYAAEAFGSVTGGLAVNALIVSIVPSYVILKVIVIITISVAAVVSCYSFCKKTCYVLVGSALISVLFTLLINIDYIYTRKLYPGQQTILKKDTPYNQVIITQYKGQRNIYLNGTIAPANDFILNEEKVHFPLSQLNQPDNILVISTNFSGILSELFKYPTVEKITILQTDPFLSDLESIRPSFDTNDIKVKINYINHDPYTFLRAGTTTFDLILVDLPAPSTLSLNKYYTLEFYELCKKRISNNGVMSFSVNGQGNYQNEEMLRFLSTLSNTLKEVFCCQILIEANKTYFMAAQKPLNYSVTQNTYKLLTENHFVNEYYVDTNLLKSRSQVISQALPAGSPVNRLYNPVACIQSIKNYLSMHNYELIGVMILLVLVVLILTRSYSPLNFGLFIGGFAVSGMEVFTIMSYQIHFGSIYQSIGIIIFCFMTGIASGAGIGQAIIKNHGYTSMVILMLLLAILSLTTPLVLKNPVVLNTLEFVLKGIYFIISIMFGLLLGVLYSRATSGKNLNFLKVSSRSYSGDMAGAASGSLLTSVILIPVLGIVNFSIILSGLCLLSATIFLLSGKQG